MENKCNQCGKKLKKISNKDLMDGDWKFTDDRSSCRVCTNEVCDNYGVLKE